MDALIRFQVSVPVAGVWLGDEAMWVGGGVFRGRHDSQEHVFV
jgi:hypothetical protein